MCQDEQRHRTTFHHAARAEPRLHGFTRIKGSGSDLSMYIRVVTVLLILICSPLLLLCGVSVSTFKLHAKMFPLLDESTHMLKSTRVQSRSRCAMKLSNPLGCVTSCLVYTDVPR